MNCVLVMMGALIIVCSLGQGSKMIGIEISVRTFAITEIERPERVSSPVNDGPLRVACYSFACTKRPFGA